MWGPLWVPPLGGSRGVRKIWMGPSATFGAHQITLTPSSRAHKFNDFLKLFFFFFYIVEFNGGAHLDELQNIWHWCNSAHPSLCFRFWKDDSGPAWKSRWCAWCTVCTGYPVQKQNCVGGFALSLSDKVFLGFFYTFFFFNWTGIIGTNEFLGLERDEDGIRHVKKA